MAFTILCSATLANSDITTFGNRTKCKWGSILIETSCWSKSRVTNCTSRQFRGLEPQLIQTYCKDSLDPPNRTTFRNRRSDQSNMNPAVCFFDASQNFQYVSTPGGNLASIDQLFSL